MDTQPGYHMTNVSLFKTSEGRQRHGMFINNYQINVTHAFSSFVKVLVVNANLLLRLFCLLQFFLPHSLLNLFFTAVFLQQENNQDFSFWRTDKPAISTSQRRPTQSYVPPSQQQHVSVLLFSKYVGIQRQSSSVLY
jgi:hypothetical protein